MGEVRKKWKHMHGFSMEEPCMSSMLNWNDLQDSKTLFFQLLIACLEVCKILRHKRYPGMSAWEDQFINIDLEQEVLKLIGFLTWAINVKKTMCDVNTEKLALENTELYIEIYIFQFRFMKCNEILLKLSSEKVMIMLLIKLFGNASFIHFDN